MRLKLKDNVAIFYPVGFLDSDILKYEISSKNKKMLRQKAIQHILISLKNAVYFNKVGFNLALDAIKQIAQENNAYIGFCDYNEVKFKALTRMAKNIQNLSFFETSNVALLFWGEFKEEFINRRIVIFNENAEQKRQLALRLSGRGYKPVIAKDFKEFKRLQKGFEYSIYLTDIKSSKKDIKMSLRENVVIYELEGFIDSAFIVNFDNKTFLNSLKIGFKFFIFDMTKSSSINVRGVAFLTKLSTQCAEYGAVIAVCGLKLSSTSSALKDDLQDYGILFYKNVDEFFNDDTTVIGGGGAVAQKSKNITKNLIEILPNILKITIDTLSSLSNLAIERKNATIEYFACDEDKFEMGSVAFYGDINAKFILCLDRKIVTEICKILLQNNEELSLTDAYADLLSVISDRIESWLKSKGLEINFTLPHVFEAISEEDKRNKGVFVTLSIEDTDAIFFLSK